MYERASRSRKQTEQKMTMTVTMYSSSHNGSGSLEVVGMVLVVVAARRAELSVGNSGLMEARLVAFCMVGGRFHPMLVYNPLQL